MKRYLGLGLVGLLLAACGTTKEEAKSKLNENTMTLDPPAGTYTYKPWVTVSKKDKDMGSGIVKAKAPGKTEFTDASSCLSSIYANSDLFDYCIQIEQSGTLEYFLYNSEAESNHQTAEYKIELPANNLSGETKSTLDNDAEALALVEKETTCGYSTSDSKLSVVVQTTSVEKLTDKRYAYVVFSVTNPVAGATAKYTAENDTDAGLEIKPISDDPPSLLFSSPTYTSKPPTDSLSDDEPEYPEASCEVTVTAFERGKVVTGTVSCANLRSWKYGPEESDELLGKLVSFSGDWSCDGYK